MEGAMEDDSSTLFSVIIPVFNDWDNLKLCLDALSKQSLDAKHYEIIVVNNGSTHPKPDPWNVPGNAKIINEDKPGSYAARNTGADVAKGKLLAFTDSDCIPNKNWLSNIKKNFSNSTYDLIGGKIEIFHPISGSKHIYIYDKHFAFNQEEWVTDGKCCTANFAIKKSVFFEAGKFDSSLKSGGDWEFSQRCVDKKFTMGYEPSVLVQHPARKNLSALLKKHLRHVYWGSIITRKQYQCGQLKVLISNLKGAIEELSMIKPRVPSWYERFVVLYIDIIKMMVQFYGNLSILLELKDPYKVRE